MQSIFQSVNAWCTEGAGGASEGQGMGGGGMWISRMIVLRAFMCEEPREAAGTARRPSRFTSSLLPCSVPSQKPFRPHFTLICRLSPGRGITRQCGWDLLEPECEGQVQDQVKAPVLHLLSSPGALHACFVKWTIHTEWMKRCDASFFFSFCF